MLDHHTTTIDEKHQITTRKEEEDLQIEVVCKIKLPEEIFHKLEEVKELKGYEHRCDLYADILKVAFEKESKSYMARKIAMGKGY